MAQQLEHGGHGAAIDVLLDLAVGELGSAPDPGPLDLGVDHDAVAVQVDAPEQGGTVAVGQQAGGSLGQDLGMPRGPTVGGVERDAPLEALGGDRSTGGDEGGDVGDGVPDPHAGPVPFGGVGLVQVETVRRVDGDQIESGVVLAGTGAGRAPSAAASSASAVTSVENPEGRAAGAEVGQAEAGANGLTRKRTWGTGM